jgi:hypothetical protein
MLRAGMNCLPARSAKKFLLRGLRGPPCFSVLKSLLASLTKYTGLEDVLLVDFFTRSQVGIQGRKTWHVAPGFPLARE